jgi:hypothetical protein
VRYLGFCPADLQAAPVAMVAFLARFLQVNPPAGAGVREFLPMLITLAQDSRPRGPSTSAL